ncbi:competence protein ComK [Oceanobacillus sp. FSL H7-0719]|uniref:competence protein ComK n=1 Tax=Oceanobacillus sp. FSL H7-0719 TaxID=2954507 RepID=UPI0032526D86
MKNKGNMNNKENVINVLDDYTIQDNVIALLPANSNEYRTIVLTSNEKLYIKLTPLEIIKASCYHNFSSYEGRREAVKYLTNFQNKVPIPVNTSGGIYAFPTKSPTNDDCVWLFYHHIKSIVDNQKGGMKSEFPSTVHFVNNTELPLNISHFSLSHQFYRTAVCKSMFDSR